MRIQYTLKLYPAGLGRSVYRTMTICGTDTLDQLCMAILSAFDFTAEHLYEFCMDNKMYSEDCYRFNPMKVDMFDEDDAEETDITLDELGLIEGQKFSLHYDFGDDWMFAIRAGVYLQTVQNYHKELPRLSGIIRVHSGRTERTSPITSERFSPQMPMQAHFPAGAAAAAVHSRPIKTVSRFYARQ